MNVRLATLLLVLLLFVTASGTLAEPPRLAPLIGAESLPGAVEQELARYVANSFFKPADKHKLSAALESDSVPRMIFASISDGEKPARVLYGAGPGAKSALSQLLDQREGTPPSWLKVDIVRDVIRETALSPERPLDLPRSLYGLAFEPEIGAAFLPEELVAQTLVDSDQRLSLRRIATRLNVVSQAEALGRDAGRRQLVVYRFSTSSYFVDGSSVQEAGYEWELIPLYRGHRRIDDVSPDTLLEAARQGGDYLRRAVGRDGRFAYSYRPKTDERRDSYNILRHAGTVYSMLELYEVTGDAQLLTATERAIDYLIRTVKTCPESPEFGDPEALCVVEKGFVKLGGNALAILALTKHAEVTGSRAHLQLLERLAFWLLATQSDDGEFTVHKVKQKTGELDDHISQYYPGEALFALLRFSQLRARLLSSTPANDRWLDAAASGARWLIEVRDRRVPDERLNHDHWLLYALNELHRQRPDQIYLKHTERTTRAIRQRQNRRPPFPDWLGSYYHPPRSTPTATRSEGLAAAYFLEREFGTPERAGELLETLELGVRFQLGTLIGPESALYLPAPRRALGGFKRSLTDFEIRIDYVQHNISALLLLRRILLERSADA